MLIAHVPYLKILTGLRGSLVIFLFLSAQVSSGIVGQWSRETLQFCL